MVIIYGLVEPISWHSLQLQRVVWNGTGHVKKIGGFLLESKIWIFSGQ